jgi:hypothetical protein
MNNDIQFFKKDNEEIMDTPQNLIDKAIEKVEEVLKKNFPDYIDFENGSYTISRGSTQVMVMVRPFTENEPVVECMSNVVSGAEINQELLQFLLRKNSEMHFGSFGLLFDNTIVFQHSLAASNLDDNELITALNAVAIIADYYDDEIVEMAGGKRAKDIMDVESD